MDKIVLERLISEGYTQRKLAKKLGCSQTNIRYYLKKYNLKTLKGARLKEIKDLNSPRSCPCGETDPTLFYGNKKRICAKCHNKKTIESGREKRLWTVDQLGGKCEHCGYNKHTCALDIHHLNPKEKDVAFNTMRYWSKERILKEIQTCILLCKNCHAIEHNKQKVD